MKKLFAALALIIGLGVVGTTTPAVAISNGMGNCHFSLNPSRTVGTTCVGTGTYSQIQTWIYCNNNPTVAVKGNYAYLVNQISWATCPVGTYYVRYVYAYWY